MITKFRVHNYKALRDVTLDLTPIHVLIGPNDSGKTSLLEAMAALCRSVDHDIRQSFLGSWNGRELVWQGAAEPVVHFSAAVCDGGGEWEYRMSVSFPATSRECVISAERLKLPDGVYRGCTLHPRKNSPHDELEFIPRIQASLAGVHLYRWVPAHLALPVAPDSSRRFRMEPSGFGLARCLDDILGFDRDRFVALEQRFKAIFPQIKSIKLVPEPAFRSPDHPQQVLLLQPSDGKGLYFEFHGRQLVPAAQVSDGVLLVLAYLTVLHLPEPPNLLLVEEPENGIHPGLLEEVLKVLREVVSEQQRTQVVFTTHSPYVVSYFSPEDVTLCQKEPDGSVQVRRLSESKTVREQMDFFTLGEIWTGEGDASLMQPAEAVGSGRVLGLVPGG